MREQLLLASRQSGLVVEWNELAKGLKQASDGKDVYYSAVTGVIRLDQRTDALANVLQPAFWTIRGGKSLP